MSKLKRDIIKEIASVRERRLFASPMPELGSRLTKLQEMFDGFDGKNSELIRYFPVALVASLETFFRYVVQELIDKGEPYLSNSEEVIQSLKIDFSILKAIHGKQVTVGELVGHTVSISRAEHIDSIMTKLLGKKFFDVLKKIPSRWSVEVLQKENQPIINDWNKIFFDLEKIFEWRHIVCHEVATIDDLDSKELDRCFESCMLFVQAVDEFVFEELYPGLPLTQSEMHIDASESLELSCELMNSALQDLLVTLSEDGKKDLLLSQKYWLKYADRWTAFSASVAEGGSLYQLLACRAKKELVELRTDEIKRWEPLGN